MSPLERKATLAQYQLGAIWMGEAIFNVVHVNSLCEYLRLSRILCKDFKFGKHQSPASFDFAHCPIFVKIGEIWPDPVG